MARGNRSLHFSGEGPPSLGIPEVDKALDEGRVVDGDTPPWGESRHQDECWTELDQWKLGMSGGRDPPWGVQKNVNRVWERRS